LQGLFRRCEGAICTSVWASTQMFSNIYTHTHTKINIHTHVHEHTHIHTKACMQLTVLRSIIITAQHFNVFTPNAR